MRDPGFPEDAQQIGRRIGFDRVERLARKFLNEIAGSTARGMRTQQCNRFDRSELGDCDSPPAIGWGGR